MIKYTIVEEKKMVVAELFNTEKDAVKRIHTMLRGGVNIDDSKYMIKHHYRAIAMCDSEDEFDLEIGKSIAAAKLLDKYYHDKNAAVNRFVEDINKTMFEITYKTIDKNE